MTRAGLAALRTVDVADVYKAGVLAGRLRRDGDDVVHDYDEAYVGDPGPRVERVGEIGYDDATTVRLQEVLTRRLAELQA